MRKRIVAGICCLMLVVTGLYIAEPQQAKAAEPSGTMSITTTIYGYSSVGSSYAHPDGYMNLGYTTTATDYKSNGQNFLDATFAEKYITYGGGMTYDDLVNGMLSFYIATGNILQFNWANRTDAFTVGWFFTIAQGALLPYVNSSGATSYMALDKEYKISFGAGNGDNEYVISITGLKATTYSLGNLGIWGNGTGNATSQIVFTDDNVRNYQSGQYHRFEADESYAEYFQLGDMTYEELVSNHVQIQTVLDGSDRCIQFVNWGTLRERLKAGDQLIFYKGLPINYKDSSGTICKAVLDATYVYECIGSNSDNTQVFYGVKLDDTTSTYGISTQASAITTVAQGTEQYWNISMTGNTNSSHAVNTDVLTDKVAEPYLKVAGYTVKEARDLGIAFRYIPNANVIQIGFSKNAVAGLKAGDTIELKKGMPVVYMYNNALCAAKLDADYTITITANNGTNLGLTWVQSGTFGLSGNIGTPIVEAGSYYYDVYFAETLFEDAKSTFQGSFYSDKASLRELIRQYFTVKGKTAETLTSDGWDLRRYNLSGFQALRFYCPTGKWNLADGDYVLFKKGFPITYTTKENKTKTITLDKDYGFRLSGTAFTYDSSINSGTQEDPKPTYLNFGLVDNTKSFVDGDQVVKFNLPLKEGAIATQPVLVNLLTDESASTFITVKGYTNEQLVNDGVCFRFYPQAGCIQIDPGSRCTMSDFSEITFKRGMTISYEDNGSKKATIDNDYEYQVTDNWNGTYTLEKAGTEEQVDEYEITLTGPAGSFEEQGVVKVNLPISGGVIAGNYVFTDIMKDAVARGYLTVDGYSTEQLSEADFHALYLPTAGVIQLAFGNVELKDGMEITFTGGMSVSYVDGNNKKRAILKQDCTYTVSYEEESNVYVMKVVENYNVTITVDGSLVLSGIYKMGTKLDLSGYRNTAKGKIMSIEVNGESVQDTTLVVSENADVVILNRADVCIVIFKDNGTIVAVRLYSLNDKNIKIPYAPDQDGYDDSWEEFQLVNDVITVNAIHKARQTEPIVDLEGASNDTDDGAGNTSATGTKTGDTTLVVLWLVLALGAAGAVTFLGYRGRKRLHKKI